ncbi:MAG: TIGR00725 family protein [Pseudomonadota bacterium]|uniref:TIGR00725 family protein n=1 Tax=Fodinicurvata fenggangensis TaxID=1121830 RepID=UPI001B8027BD|nr:TIGR00725 family protein [Fodinicurvata fenggangensis]
MQTDSYLIAQESIYGPQGRLDPWFWHWLPEESPAKAMAASPRRALEHLARTGEMRRIPVGVIGPREATDEQLGLAEEIGSALGRLNLTVICGGKTGVMEAVARGCHTAGGLSVGLLPDHDWRTANDYIALPIATGMSEARNMIIAKSSVALIAVGGSYGTLSEIAYGLHFSKPVIGLAGAHAIKGVEIVADAAAAIDRLAAHLLASAAG